MPGTLEDAATGISRLISIFRDAEQGFRSASEAARDPSLRGMLLSHSTQHGEFAGKLQQAVRTLGYDPALPAGLGGVAYGGWIKLKALVTSHDQHAILVEAERGEEWVRDICRELLDKTLPPAIRSLVEIQFAEIEQTCASLQARRDATAPRSDRL